MRGPAAPRSTTRGAPSVAPRSRRARALGRWWLALVLALGCWFGAVPARAQAPAPVHAHAHAFPNDAPVASPGLALPPVPAGFNVHDAGWVRFVYEPGARRRVQPLMDAAPGVRAELTAALGHPVLDRVVVMVARTPGEMASFAPAGTTLPGYADGVAFSSIGLVLLTLDPVNPRSPHDLGQVFRHELAHVALHDAVGGQPIPRWFNEGLAVHFSGETHVERLQTLWTATLAETLIPLRQLDRFPGDEVGVQVAYAQSADVVRFLLRDHDADRFRRFIGQHRLTGSFEGALSEAYSSRLEDLEYEWRQEVARRYSFWPVLLGGGVVWVLAFVLVGLAWRRKREKQRAVLTRWTREEAAEDARRVAVERARLAAEAAARPPVPTPEGAFPPPAPVPKVQHGGGWHTLH